MGQTHHFFAFDLGATSGRSMLATLQNGTIVLKELTRFSNNILRIENKYYWNIYLLFEELKKGLKATTAMGIELDAIGIDTWGVDFVFVAQDGSFSGLPRAYRDPYTIGIPEEYFSNVFSRKEVYDVTGIQVMNFNSLFQLYAAKKEQSSALLNANSILFMPDALSYLLTGKKVCEFTIASTSQFLNLFTKKIEAKFLEEIGVAASMIHPVVMPGEIIGKLSCSVMEECNMKSVPVIAVAGHDTGSAVAAVPAENENFAYLSSGTWSLMGIEVKDPIINEESFELNFTNEGGVEATTRFLKNITGMWLLEQCRKEWKEQGICFTHAEIVELSHTIEPFAFLIDPDHSSFANPASMTKAIADYCTATGQTPPQNYAEYIRCIFDSLALKYKYVLDCLQHVAPFKIEKLHVIGGGSQNKLLNQLTANAIGMQVVAGPAEATAIGNVMTQGKGLGIVQSLSEMRAIIRNSISLEIFHPESVDGSDLAYSRFLSIINRNEVPV